MENEPLVGANVVIRETGVPRKALYRMIRDGEIPAYHERKPWQKEGFWRFRLSEVKAALEKLSVSAA